jgi:hypothetical protein
MPALVALKDACLQIVDGMRASPSQMRIAAALATAKRCNKLVILHNYGMLFHTSPRSQQRECGACPPSSAPAPHSAVPVPDQVAIIRLEDGEERADPLAFAH